MIEPLIKPRPVRAVAGVAPPAAYLWRDIVEELRFSGAWRADQVGAGLLVGHHYRCPEDDASYVEIDGFIAGTHLPDASTFSRHLRQEWRAAAAAVRDQFGEAEVLGWYLSLPRPRAPGQAELVLHNTYFSHPWQLGLWIVPEAAPAALRVTPSGFERLAVTVLEPA